MAPSTTGAPEEHAWFETTHWTVVFLAREGNSTAAEEALERLCRSYWPPIFAYLRRLGHAAAEAEDLTQSFFARMLERGYLSRLQHRNGKFRSFLLTFLKHFLLEQHGRASAKKRGGGMTFVALDAFDDEERRAWEPASTLTPDQTFDRRWAQVLLDTALTRLQAEYETTGRGHLFAALKDIHRGERAEAGYAELGATLGLTEAAVKSALQRMRQRHRELLREEIAKTVGDPRGFREEVRHFMEILR